jgi:hypothetical protein
LSDCVGNSVEGLGRGFSDEALKLGKRDRRRPRSLYLIKRRPAEAEQFLGRDHGTRFAAAAIFIPKSSRLSIRVPGRDASAVRMTFSAITAMNARPIGANSTTIMGIAIARLNQKTGDSSRRIPLSDEVGGETTVDETVRERPEHSQKANRPEASRQQPREGD